MAVPSNTPVPIAISVRPEETRDTVLVRRVEQAAFGQPNEANLVDALRSGGYVTVSLIAEVAGVVRGHILFSPVTVHDSTHEWRALALGPLAVDPDYQRRGVGTALVRAGLETCVQAGHPIVFVLGHPTYYSRFGFRPAEALGIGCEWAVPPEVFMVAELQPGALAGRRGTVHYAPPFHAP